MTTIAISALVAILAPSQEPSTAPLSPGKPTEMHQYLAKMAGDWEVDISYDVGGMKGASSATCKAEMILGGLFLTRTYNSKMGGMDFVVMQTVGYDSIRKEFFEWHIESNNSGRLTTVGTRLEGSGIIVCKGTALDPFTLKPAERKTRTIIDSKDKFTTEWWLKVGDKPEEKQVVMVHTRKK